MAITRSQVENLSELVTWLNTNCTDIIAGGVISDGENVWAGYDADNNKVFQIAGSWLKFYRGASNDVSVLPDNGRAPQNISSNGADIIKCDNGVIINTTYYNSDGSGGTYDAYILFAKTNNGKVACIGKFCNNGKTTPTSEIYHVAFGDNSTIDTTTNFTPESGQQTIMTTFATNADITQVSYTPKAFYMPMHSAYNSGIGKFLCGGKVYITNGYWCIDTETYEEDAT